MLGFNRAVLTPGLAGLGLGGKGGILEIAHACATAPGAAVAGV